MYNWTDGELVTAEKLNNYSKGMEEIKEAAITAKEAAQASAKEAAETVESKAPLASPTFTGTPTAPTPDTDDNSTRIATTAFVDGVKKAVLGGLIFSITAEGLVHVEQEV